MPNVEETEAFYPILHLWRRVVPDSGGAGRWRGGNSMETAVVPHGIDGVAHYPASSGHHAAPLSPLFGGYPSTVNRFLLQRDTDALEQLAAGKVPQPGGLKVGQEDEIEPKAFGVPQGAKDVFLLSWAGGGGFGDPLEREPEAVAADVAAGAVGAESARRLYAVVLTDGTVDADATAKLREEHLAGRRNWDGPKDPKRLDPQPAGETPRLLGPDLRLRGDNGATVITCRCDTVLSGAHENWKTGALFHEISIPEANLITPDPGRLTDDDVVMRQYACPGCARLLDADVVRADEPPLWDIRIKEQN
jgi:N-methylhydantoinase B